MMRSETARQSGGFTLIEVLVALAIVIIAFMAMYGSMIQVVAATTLAQEKTIATWIALDRITELRVSGEFPDADTTTGDIEMGGIEWLYRIEINVTGENIRQIIARVYPADEPENMMGIASGVLLKPNTNDANCPPGQVCQ